jgi:hypothetical protein
MRTAIRARFRALIKDVSALFNLAHKVSSWPTGAKVKVQLPDRSVNVSWKKIQATFVDWKKQMSKNTELSLKFKRTSPRMSTINWYSNQLIGFLTAAFGAPTSLNMPSSKSPTYQRDLALSQTVAANYQRMVQLFASKGERYDPAKFDVIFEGVASHNIITLLFTLYSKTHQAPGDETYMGLKSPLEPRRIRYDELMEQKFGGKSDSVLRTGTVELKEDKDDKFTPAERQRSAFSLIQYAPDGKENVTESKGSKGSIPAFIPRSADSTNMLKYGFMMASIMKIGSFFRIRPEIIPATTAVSQPIVISTAGKNIIKKVKAELAAQIKAQAMAPDEAIRFQYAETIKRLTTQEDLVAYDKQFKVWEAAKYAQKLNEAIDPESARKKKSSPKTIPTAESIMSDARAITPSRVQQARRIAININPPLPTIAAPGPF